MTINNFRISPKSKVGQLIGNTLTVKQLIIGDDLFGEIGEINKFAKINRHQNSNIAVLRQSRVGNRQINYLPNCHIWKTAKYNSRQTFSFYSITFDLTDLCCHSNTGL